MKRMLRRSIAILIILSLMLFSAGCEKDKDAHRTETRDKMSPRSVTTATVELRNVQPSSAQATGTMVPRRHTDLHALVDGQIEKLPVDIGERVKKGQLLFKIRTVDYRLSLQHAEANLARARVVIKDKKREKDRMQNLFKAGSASEQLRDLAITAYEEAEAALKQAQAARDTARQFLIDCTVNAHYDGVVTARYVEEGEYVKKGARVVEIMDLTILNAEMELPERYAGKIDQNLPVTLSFGSRSESVAGKIVAVNPKVNPANRTFLVKVAVDNKNGKLQAGLFCSASFQFPIRKNQLTIPSAALSRDEGYSAVWVVKDGKAYRRKVREGGITNGLVWILDGLKAGDLVITKGTSGLIKGSEVVIEKPKEKAKDEEQKK